MSPSHGVGRGRHDFLLQIDCLARQRRDRTQDRFKVGEGPAYLDGPAARNDERDAIARADAEMVSDPNGHRDAAIMVDGLDKIR